MSDDIVEHLRIGLPLAHQRSTAMKILNEAADEIERLRNPWVSVEDEPILDTSDWLVLTSFPSVRIAIAPFTTMQGNWAGHSGYPATHWMRIPALPGDAVTRCSSDFSS